MAHGGCTRDGGVESSASEAVSFPFQGAEPRRAVGGASWGDVAERQQAGASVRVGHLGSLHAAYVGEPTVAGTTAEVLVGGGLVRG